MSDARRSRAFSLVETVISGAVLSLLAGAVLSATSAAAERKQDAALRVRAFQLAQDMLGELRRKAYRDPRAGASDPIGLEAGEQGRSAFNDVDDYDGHEESPVLDANGLELVGFTGFSRSTRVILVSTQDRISPSATDLGVKRAVVRVSYLGKPISEVSGEIVLACERAWR